MIRIRIDNTILNMELNHENLVNLMRFRPTLKVTADWFGTSEDTIERRVRKWEKITFGEFKEKYSQHIRFKLMDRAIEMAMSGNATIMIFALKNFCGWTDRIHEPEATEADSSKFQLFYKGEAHNVQDGTKPFELAYNPKDLKRER